jgi:hypothetical protein
MSSEADKLARLRNGSDQAFFLAPLLVLVCSKRTSQRKRRFE